MASASACRDGPGSDVRVRRHHVNLPLRFGIAAVERRISVSHGVCGMEREVEREEQGRGRKGKSRRDRDSQEQKGGARNQQV